MSFLRAKLGFVAVLTTAFLSGCVVPFPHTQTRSFEISGRVVNAANGMPIEGATIQAAIEKSRHYTPTQPSTVSDKAGLFWLERSRYMLWTKTFFAPCYGSVHEGGKFIADFLISHEGYATAHVTILNLTKDNAKRGDPGAHELGTIRLYPGSRGEMRDIDGQR